MLSRSEYIKAKIVTLDKAVQLRNIWGLKREKVVFTNGCFDLLHQGHIEYLVKAAELGNRLVVGINTDRSVKALEKGDERPINGEESRALLVAALGFVDSVVLFEEDTPYNLVKVLAPDVLVKGGDYDENEENKSKKSFIVGSDLVRSSGGTIKTIALSPGFSSTHLINKIKS